MDTSILMDLGFSNAETKVYLALLELGESTAGPILDKTGLQNSVVHMTLHRLLEKGLVSYVKKDKVKHYQAANPKNILKFIEGKKSRFKEILPELLIKQKKHEKQEAEVFEGFEGFRGMLYEFIGNAKKGDEYLFFSFYTENPDDFDNVYTFYREFEKERKKLGIVVKGIAPISIKDKFKGRDISSVKFVDFPVPLNISIFKDRVIMTPWGDKKVSFFLHSRQLADSLRKYFYSIWDAQKDKWTSMKHNIYKEKSSPDTKRKKPPVV